MLQDTELWSVLEVSPLHRSQFLSNRPATWQKTFMRWRTRSARLYNQSIFTNRFTASTPGLRPTLARWTVASRHGYRKQVSPQAIQPARSLSLSFGPFAHHASHGIHRL